ncbi:conserved Plasmodium protein, unknown function [Plasmodium berghei]|uniref:BTB/POZ domain-containing protein, putative n=2 Tax=Plasmodium berghei TaxID=5821 RepID=A0A509ARC6_PLABA|nr:BTB/POZ domain-containing protein, putative [Plasmodium berghei ANKA]CXJ26597.1 conserved Plasmodium protein, unknown function [Plasmodium berghei]SCN28713.1 conserved Plasmodium protein, unknown function [Plasmodium berghei]SCO64460.1 conserved Plasmodium protein, unknown function [Plasmodium berghei]VUC58595.1 BTB/POZ domain-containing protein, putative [Plasmodium berghei ANKA]|eukprot:XP_034424358.1 BTB/POZ domain-containing protein, putative [Plasmodium berghei ANKA]
MEKLNKEHIISINAGGKIYMTTLNLISRYKNSRLYEIVQDDIKKREIFIDRNGNRFEYILDFLRDGVLICETDITVLTRILIEAIYFKLFSLMKIIIKKINLLYSNMSNSVNKNIFKRIISKIEKNRKKETNKLVKLPGIISNYNELKYFNLKKKKKKSYISILNNSNIINEINQVDKDIEKVFTKPDKNDSTNFQKNESPNKLNWQSITNEKERKKTNAYKESHYGTNINSEKNMNSQEKIPNIYTKKAWSDEEQFGNIKNSKDEKDTNSNPKNISRLRNINVINNKISELSYNNYIGNSDYIGYCDCENEDNNFPNYINSVRNKKSTYNYKNYEYNNMKNNVRNPIMVYSEVDDVEETSNYPIMPNINLGEQIFSTTVDF